jgi:AcrR family transcriptional regulator
MDTAWNQPLPRGRHHLSRAEVAASQRQRILMAMIEEVAQRGYAATSVAHITTRAGVSRKSFYEQFSDKEECYLNAFDIAATQLQTCVESAVTVLPDDAPALERFRAMLRAFLDAVARWPAAARTLLIEVYAVGPEAMARKAGARRHIIAAVLGPLGIEDDDRLSFEGEFAMASILALITQWVAEGRADEVPGLCDPLVSLVARHLDCRPAAEPSELTVPAPREERRARVRETIETSAG